MKKSITILFICSLLASCSFLPFKPIAPHIKVNIEINLLKQEEVDQTRS